MGSSWRLTLILAPLLALHVSATGRLESLPRVQDPRELDAVLPLAAQIVLAAGDRYLAGNLATIRALMAAPHRMTPDQMSLLAKVHEDAAFLHPGNEDNYYVAANILPWNGQYAAGQRVIERAYQARTFDWLPAFYYGFDLWYFEKQPAAGAGWLKRAATRANDEGDRLLLDTLSARWLEQGYDTASALRLLRGIAAEERHSRMKQYYAARIRRLESLLELEQAAARYVERRGAPLHRLDQLVDEGLIDGVPVDPLGFGYGVDAKGRPFLINSPSMEAGK